MVTTTNIKGNVFLVAHCVHDLPGYYPHDTFCWKQLPALMEMFVWLVVAHNMKGEWRCVLMEDGAQCAMITGVPSMLK